MVLVWNPWGAEEENLAASVLYPVYLGSSLLLKWGTDHARSSASRQLDPFCLVRKDSCTHLFPVSCRHPREPSLPVRICDWSCVSGQGHRIGQYNRWQQNKSIWVPFPYVAVRLMEALSFVGKWKPESALHCLATQVNPKGDHFLMTCRKPRQPDWVCLARNVLLDGLSEEVKGLGNKIDWPRPLLLLEVSEGRDSSGIPDELW